MSQQVSVQAIRLTYRVRVQAAGLEHVVERLDYRCSGVYRTPEVYQQVQPYRSSLRGTLQALRALSQGSFAGAAQSLTPSTLRARLAAVSRKKDK